MKAYVLKRHRRTVLHRGVRLLALLATAPLLGANGCGTPPTAQFTMTPSPARTSDVVTFDASSSLPGERGEGCYDFNGIISYEWDLDGNGTFEVSGTTVTRRYERTQTVTVGLRVTNSCLLSDDEEKPLVILGPSETDLDTDNTSRVVCGPQTYSVYFAGPVVDGSKLDASTQFCEIVEPGRGRNVFVTYRYGTCEPPGVDGDVEGGCTAPVEVQSAPLCERHANLYKVGPEGDPYPRTDLTVRGVPAALFAGGPIVTLEVYTGDTTVAIHGSSADQVKNVAEQVTLAPRTSIPEVDQTLSVVESVGRTGSDLPPPRPGALESTEECLG